MDSVTLDVMLGLSDVRTNFMLYFGENCCGFLMKKHSDSCGLNALFKIICIGPYAYQFVTKQTTNRTFLVCTAEL